MSLYEHNGDDAHRILDSLPPGIQSAMKLLVRSMKGQLPPGSSIGLSPMRNPDDHTDRGVVLLVVDPIDAPYLPESAKDHARAKGQDYIATPLCMFKEDIAAWDKYESDPDSPLAHVETAHPEPVKKPRFNMPSEN